MKTGTLLLSCAIALVGASAYANVVTGDVVGTSEAEVRASLEQSGYSVLSIEIDGNEIEVEASLDGVATEIEVSSDTGAVTEIESGDDDDDDDDENDKDGDDDKNN